MQQEQVIHKIKQLAQHLVPEGSHLWLYGSRARGDNRPDSDWDLLLLLNKDKETKNDFDNISYPLIELGLDLGQHISVHTYTRKDWNRLSFSPFRHNVEQDKKVII